MNLLHCGATTVIYFAVVQKLFKHMHFFVQLTRLSPNYLNILKLALLQVFYALYWPVNAKKNYFVHFIF